PVARIVLPLKWAAGSSILAFCRLSTPSLVMNTVKLSLSLKSSLEFRKKTSLPLPTDATFISTVHFSLTFLAAASGVRGLPSSPAVRATTGTKAITSATASKRIGDTPRDREERSAGCECANVLHRRGHWLVNSGGSAQQLVAVGEHRRRPAGVQEHQRLVALHAPLTHVVDQARHRLGSVRRVEQNPLGAGQQVQRLAPRRCH